MSESEMTNGEICIHLRVLAESSALTFREQMLLCEAAQRIEGLERDKVRLDNIFAHPKMDILYRTDTEYIGIKDREQLDAISEATPCPICHDLGMVPSNEEVMNTPCPNCNPWAKAFTRSLDMNTNNKNAIKEDES